MQRESREAIRVASFDAVSLYLADCLILRPALCSSAECGPRFQADYYIIYASVALVVYLSIQDDVLSRDVSRLIYF